MNLDIQKKRHEVAIMKMRLGVKLLVIGVTLSVVPLVVTGVTTWLQNSQMVEAAKTGNTELANSDLDHVATQVETMCEAHQDALQKLLGTSMRVASDALVKGGPVAMDEKEMVPWKAVNQVTKDVREVELPRMQVGRTWLGKTSDAQERAALVDDVQKLTGGACTVFQRMNAKGDMLRVSTNVITKEGTRAIGTYIAAESSDGVASPVVSAVLRGETYVGRAYVVNGWYATAYSPIRDAKGEVAGMLFVGIPERDATESLHKAITSIKIGKTGYVWVLNAMESTKGTYVVSKDGAADGKNIWDATDESGGKFIQTICAKAVALEKGKLGEVRYVWKGPSEEKPREKIVRIAYFKPWDWVIGVGAYEDEFNHGVRVIEGIEGRSRMIQVGMIGTALLASVGIWWAVARGITRPINRIIAALSAGSGETNASAGQVAKSSEALAQGASEQAAALEETTSALEEMSSMTKRNSETTLQAEVMFKEAHHAAEQGNAAMGRMATAIDDIQKSAGETAKIIKVIDEIAFQTNLLALNAAVEAARAGESGKGFAVVAEEVRNLAMRSAQAAKNTAALIEGSVKKAANGVSMAQEVGKTLTSITNSASKVNGLLGEIAAASKEQSTGIAQINVAVREMDKVTQVNAANAEESANASKKLSGQAEEMDRVVRELEGLVGARDG